MSVTLSGVDVRVLTKELQDEIVGSWVQNIYHLPSGIFLFKLRKPQVGLQFLLIEPGLRIHLSQFNRVMPSEPSNFCRVLRKHLRDRRINSIEQRDIDRIVILNIGPDKGIDIVIELFGKGNMIMVSEANKIINALSYRKMRDRDIHPGRIYKHMPSIDRDILRTGTDGLKELLSTNSKIVPVMNNWLGLGPYYSRYILKQLNITKKKSEEIDDEDITRITNKAIELKNLLENHQYKPVVYIDREIGVSLSQEDNDLSYIEDDDKLVSEYDEQWSDLPFNPEDVIKILPWEQMNAETYFPKSFGDALDIFFSSQEKEEDIVGETEELSSASERLTNILNQQISHQNALREEGIELRKNAESLYEYFQPATDLISTVYSARKNNMNWKEIEKRLILGKKKGIASAKIFKSLDFSIGMMNLEFESDGKLREVEVDFRISLNENANLLYEKAKKNEKKAKGADIAISMTRDKIKAVEDGTVKLQKKVIDQKLVLKRRKSWYEKFHWTFAPSGMLIIAGTDASTNEKIVKTYLEDDDIFLHADIQGAAATIIKTGGREVNETTLKTAASISVSYSAAWKLQRPTADAYSVEKDQVSLSAPTGQFLPKGGFMIYGRKTFIRDIPLKLYIGLILEKHWARLILSVDQNIEGASVIIELIPGDLQRGKVAKQIKKGFINHVDIMEVNKIKTIDIGDFALLIPGPSKISKWIKN